MRPILRRTSAWLLLLALFWSAAFAREDHPPLDLLLANVATTDITVVVKILAVTQVRDDGGYVTWQIDARVLRRFKGNLKIGERISYRRTLETGFRPPLPHSRHIVSFMRENGQLQIPDVGYHFDATPRLEKSLAAALHTR